MGTGFKKMWPATIVFFIALQFHVHPVHSQDTCITPDGRTGVCKGIKQCSPLLIVLRSQGPEAGDFLRSSVCGSDGRFPKVCCPESETGNIQVEPKTRKPPTRPTTQSQGQNRYGPLLPRECGFSNATLRRVVGGVSANLGSWPWVAELGYRNSNGNPKPQWRCGGSLISKKHVITAGHCVHGRNDLIVVRLGDLDLDDNRYDGANPVDVPVKNAVVHPNYNAKTFTNDIAIIKLEREVTFTDLLHPICLPVTPEVKDKNFVAKYPFVAGWGALHFRGPSTTQLQEVQLPVVTNEKCHEAYAPLQKTVIDDRVMCAGYALGGKDACQGDSGGPFMFPGSETRAWYLIGAVSYGFRCAEPGYPGVYTRIDRFLDFIISNLD